MAHVASSVNTAVPPKELLHILIIGFAFATTFYGITIMQAYVYCRRYPEDSIRLKICVLLLFVLDTLTTVFAAHALYTYAVSDYLQPVKLGVVTWSLIMEDYLTVVIATIVQFYFTRSLWIFSRRNRPLAAILVFLTLLGLGSGTWIAADLFMEPSVVTLYAVVKPRIVVAVCSGSTAVADVIISAGLCIFLQMSRTGIQRSNTMIDKLMIYAIQRGLLTATVQMIDFITIVAAPTSLAVVPAGLMLSKLYTNAFLASLNVRHSLREEISGTRISIELGPIPDLEFACESDTAVVQNSDPGCPSHAGPAPIHSTVSTAASGINCPRLTNEMATDIPCLHA